MRIASTLTAFFAFLLSLSQIFGQCSELFISEYGEGSGNTRYVEIYNPTGAAVSLSGSYRLWFISNGGNWPESYYSFPAGAVVAPYDAIVIAHNSSNVPGADYYTTSLTFNGDDAVGLAKNTSGNYILIDAVGGNGADPGTGWAVAGTANATADKVLSRKSSILQGNTNWTASRGTSAATSEWVLSPGSYSSGASATLGSHSSSCTGLPVCVSPQPAISATLTPTPTVSGIIGVLIGLMVPVDFGGQSHLLVLSSSPQLSAAPVNGSVYAPGSTLGNGVVIGSISSSNGTLYSSSLLPGATYYAFVFSYNHSSCSGGPAYSLTSANTTITLPASAAPFFGGSAQAAVESDADLFPGVQSWFASVLPGSVLRLHAEVSEAGELNYEILDLSGRTLRQELRQVSAGVWEEDLSFSIPGGLYLIRLSIHDQSRVLKVRL